MLTHIQASLIDSCRFDSFTAAHRAGARLFDRVHSQALFHQLFARLLGKANHLQTLSHQPEAVSRITGIISVPLSKIVGTECRSEDFDASFRPLKKHLRERWISVASARRTGIVLPAVELVQDGSEFYVRDGHHRISIARALGQLEIDARIVN
jgi:hypothetical protein